LPRATVEGRSAAHAGPIAGGGDRRQASGEGPPFIAEVFDISGFCDLFEIVVTLDEAVAALS
jgi:hypothetical protein